MKTPEEIMDSEGFVFDMLSRQEAHKCICLAVQEAVEECFEKQFTYGPDGIRDHFKKAGY